MKIIEINQTDEIYPKGLLTIKNPPLKLYALGNIKLLQEDLFSVVGTRHITDYGKKYGEEICKELVLRNIVLVSRNGYRNRYFGASNLS